MILHFRFTRLYRIGVYAFLLVIAFGASTNSIAQQQIFDSLKIIQPGASLQKHSDQFSFTEGPAVNKKGDIYFTDQPNDRIWKFDTEQKLSIYMEKTGRSNGLYFDKQGNLIACADEKDELWSISPNGKKIVLLSSYEGKLLNGPNDLWITPGGGIYFTDPYYQRDYWTRKKPDIDGQKVYYLAKGAKEAKVSDDQLQQPNGIVGSKDGKTLFVSDIRDSKTYRYTINADGSLTNRQLFVSMGSDGMTLDEKGNLYLSGRGVTVFNPSGQKIAFIPVPSKWVGNMCFGGKDRKTLFITASESIYSIRMTVKGIE